MSLSNFAHLFPQPWLFPLAMAVLGAILASFCNVVISRLPRMIWREAMASGELDASERTSATSNSAATVTVSPSPELCAPADMSLWHPGSHCPQCQTAIHWYDNIPLISYLVLRGRCRHCKTSIPFRYWFMELCGAAIFSYTAWRFGPQASALLWGVFLLVLLTATWIDIDHFLLPDSLTLTLMWLGLLASSAGLLDAVRPTEAIWGAALGYLSLWAVYMLFKILTGREGMGYGDFKLMAAIGAWTGVQGLLPVILISSCTGTLLGALMLWRQKSKQKNAVTSNSASMQTQLDLPDGAFPFGPYLALGAAVYVWLQPYLRPLFH